MELRTRKNGMWSSSTSLYRVREAIQSSPANSSAVRAFLRKRNCEDGIQQEIHRPNFKPSVQVPPSAPILISPLVRSVSALFHHPEYNIAFEYPSGRNHFHRARGCAGRNCSDDFVR
jgi:hypothetical protein